MMPHFRGSVTSEQRSRHKADVLLRSRVFTIG